MRTLTEQLSNYAAYHRDRRNIATHFVGVPMILFASTALLSRPAALAPTVSLAVAIFYFLLDVRYGFAMTALLIGCVVGGARVAALPTSMWLAISIGMFAIGWVIQFIGHAFEGRKPAFVDDLVGLLIGPLFVVAEAGFALGLRDDLRLAIEEKVGPTHGATASTAR
jgi:uncharacterized membrane protein YGL010W